MTPIIQLSLEGNAILRPLMEADVTQDYADGLNDPEVNRFLVGPRLQYQSMELVRAFVCTNAADPEAVLFGLFIDGALRGTARLHDIRPAEGKAWLGLALFDRAIWGRGWGHRMIAAISEWALEKFALQEIVAGIEEANEGSRKTFLRAGFTADTESFIAHGKTARWWRRKRCCAMSAKIRCTAN
jgi:RimJ/RimL family protein N-acetyltransferase